MSLPAVSCREVVGAFETFGWTAVRQTGSHVIMTRPGSQASLSVPNHRIVARGTLRALIRSAGLTIDEFVAAL